MKAVASHQNRSGGIKSFLDDYLAYFDVLRTNLRPAAQIDQPDGQASMRVVGEFS